MRNFRFKYFIIGVLSFFCIFEPALAITNAPFPRRANYFLHYQLDESKARELAKWDLVILDMETQVNSASWLRKIREWNPRILMLAYITPQEIRTDASTSGSALRRKLASGISSEWYVMNSRGNNLSFWPGTSILNVTPECPRVNGQVWTEYMANFVNKEILSTGLWDGIFYDNAWGDVVPILGSDIDTDRNGSPNTDADARWRAGMVALYRSTRELTGPNFVIVGNGTTRAYRDEVNGMMIENFIPGAWTPTMRTYGFNNTGTSPRVNVLNTNTLNKGNQNDYKTMRFGLTSALLEDGYYSFDKGDQDHGQLWHYDEYTVDLGLPQGKSTSPDGKTNYDPGVWRRDFAYGITVLNSSGERREVDLEGDYEKIHGVQDKAANDGAIVSELSLDAYDGRLLLKTLSTVYDMLYTNGSFVRFYNPNGTRARNGFFVFDPAYKGGDKIIRIDLDGNGRRDTVVFSTNKIEGTRDDGQVLFKIYPYTANFTSTLSGTIGDLNKDNKLELLISPGSATRQGLFTYDKDGNVIGDIWWPFGNKYGNGYHTAIAANAKTQERFILVGAGKGVEPYIYLYDANSKLIRKWLAFEKQFKGGVSAAAGDIDGDGVSEVVVGAGPGKKPIVKIFNLEGKEILPSFTAYQTPGLPGAEVGAVDVNFDGKSEIVVVSKGV